MLTPTLFADALLAYSIHEHQLGHVKRIMLHVEPRALTIQDDGRGMGLDREGYVESLMGLFTGRGGEVPLHGIGLAIIATSSPCVTVQSRRGEKFWSQSFTHGVPDAPPRQATPVFDAGTRITVVVAPNDANIDADEVRRIAARWQRTSPGVVIEVQTAAKAGDLPPLPPANPGRYRHYKGQDYEVFDVVRHSETLQPLVLYRTLYDDSGLWVRPYAMFHEQVEADGRTQPRFAPVQA